MWWRGSSCKHILIMNSGLAPCCHLSGGSWTLTLFQHQNKQQPWLGQQIWPSVVLSRDMWVFRVFGKLRYGKWPSKTIMILSSWECYNQIWNQLLLKMHVKCEKHCRVKHMSRTGYFSSFQPRNLCLSSGRLLKVFLIWDRFSRSGIYPFRMAFVGHTLRPFFFLCLFLAFFEERLKTLGNQHKI